MPSEFSDELHPGRPTGDGGERRGRNHHDNWFTVTTLPYIPPSCLSGYDTRYEQGLEQLVYLETLIDEEIEQ
jgi:hypothetical protein